MAKCKCNRGKDRRICYQPYHRGQEKETPETLLCSCYSAYANHLADHIIRTTHLRQGQKDSSFIEKSYFTKVEGVWRYHSGGQGKHARTPS